MTDYEDYEGSITLACLEYGTLFCDADGKLCDCDKEVED